MNIENKTQSAEWQMDEKAYEDALKEAKVYAKRDYERVKKRIPDSVEFGWKTGIMAIAVIVAVAATFGYVSRDTSVQDRFDSISLSKSKMAKLVAQSREIALKYEEEKKKMEEAKAWLKENKGIVVQ